ncbi:MAG: hypothetical protein ACK4J0_00210, partial [Candidatus Anstonellaceae archaeon]
MIYKKLGAKFLLLFFVSFTIIFAQSQNPACQNPPLSSFLKMYYEHDIKSDQTKLYLTLYGKTQPDQNNLGNAFVEPYQPLKYGYILISQKEELSQQQSQQETSCYVVTNESGQATVFLNSQPGFCYVISAKFIPDYSKISSNPSCQSFISNNPSIHKEYLPSLNQLKYCVPGEKKQTTTVCWFSTIIAGLIFAATFIMGRNPLLFFDLGVSRSLPSK